MADSLLQQKIDATAANSPKRWEMYDAAVELILAAIATGASAPPTGGATAAKQDIGNAAIAALLTGTILAAGNAIIGKFGVDQTAGQNLIVLTGVTRTPTSLSVNSPTGTTVATGKKSVTVALGKTFVGTVQGDVYVADPDAELGARVVGFEASAGDVLGVITITCSAGSYRVIIVP